MSEPNEPEKFETVKDWESKELTTERERAEKAHARYIDARSDSATLNGTLRAEIAKLEGQLAAANDAATRAKDTVARLRAELADAKRDREYEIMFKRGQDGLMLSPLRIKVV